MQGRISSEDQMVSCVHISLYVRTDYKGESVEATQPARLLRVYCMYTARTRQVQQCSQSSVPFTWKLLSQGAIYMWVQCLVLPRPPLLHTNRINSQVHLLGACCTCHQFSHSEFLLVDYIEAELATSLSCMLIRYASAVARLWWLINEFQFLTLIFFSYPMVLISPWHSLYLSTRKGVHLTTWSVVQSSFPAHAI